MSKPLQRVRGTQDLLPESMIRHRWIESQALGLSRVFGFKEISTPLFEMSEVFHRTLGETSDMVHKETYTFTDRGGDSLTLRPEGTAGIARAFVTEGLAQSLPLKFFYSGPMFRYERPQKGRFRQFHQIGVECLGYDTPYSDIEILQLSYELLESLNLMKDCTLKINTLGDSESRQSHRAALVEYLNRFKSELSPDSQLRLEKNPLRILDSKDPQDRKILEGSPKIQDHLNADSQKFFEKILSGLEKSKIPFELDSHLVRGIDYYTHTVFEFVTEKLGAQGTVLAGGRYDGLIHQMGGPAVPGVGWAAGVERLSDLLASSQVPQTSLVAAVVPADDAGDIWALQVAQRVRRAGLETEIFWNGNVGKKMKKAAAAQARYALILGSNEAQNHSITVKNLATGEQKLVKIEALIENLS